MIGHLKPPFLLAACVLLGLLVNVWWTLPEKALQLVPDADVDPQSQTQPHIYPGCSPCKRDGSMKGCWDMPPDFALFDQNFDPVQNPFARKGIFWKSWSTAPASAAMELNSEGLQSFCNAPDAAATAGIFEDHADLYVNSKSGTGLQKRHEVLQRIGPAIAWAQTQTSASDMYPETTSCTAISGTCPTNSWHGYTNFITQEQAMCAQNTQCQSGYDSIKNLLSYQTQNEFLQGVKSLAQVLLDETRYPNYYGSPTDYVGRATQSEHIRHALYCSPNVYKTQRNTFQDAKSAIGERVVNVGYMSLWMNDDTDSGYPHDRTVAQSFAYPSGNGFCIDIKIPVEFYPLCGRTGVSFPHGDYQCLVPPLSMPLYITSIEDVLADSMFDSYVSFKVEATAMFPEGYVLKRDGSGAPLITCSRKYARTACQDRGCTWIQPNTRWMTVEEPNGVLKAVESHDEDLCCVCGKPNNDVAE